MDDFETFPSIETPITVTAPSPAPSDTTTSELTPAPGDQTPVSPVQHHEPQAPHSDPSNGVDVRSVTPTKLNPASIFDFDQRIPGVLNQLSPAHIQQLVNSLSSQPIPDPNLPTTNSTVPPTSSLSNTNSLTHYSPPPPFDFSTLTNPSNNGGFLSPLQLPPPSEGLIAFSPYDHLQPERLERCWEAAKDIDKDVNALNTSIHQLIQTFGLDPSLVGGVDPSAELTAFECPHTSSSSSFSSLSHNDLGSR